MVIEAVVKERYESYLDKHLLEPLGMHMSTFNFASQVGQFKILRLLWAILKMALAKPRYQCFKTGRAVHNDCL